MRFIILTILISINSILQGQTLPVFSQYLYNKMLLNPAFAGIDKTLSADLFQREQWLGIEGAPSFQTLAVHTSLKNQKVGLGFSLMNEKRGIFHQDQLYFNYAYKIVGGDKKLSLGIRAGVHYLNNKWSNINTIDPDPAFTDAVPSAILPNFGIGLYYCTNQYFISFSIPYLLSHVSNLSDGGMKAELDFSNYSYLLSWGMNINTENIKITPSMLLKYNQGLGEQIDINLMAYFMQDKFGIGNSFRLHDAYAILADYQIIPQMRAGFCYDFPVAKLSRFSNGSIEFVLRYIFHYKFYSTSPRL